jgi:4-amino-4-deoxy-L-arabinose transferase-like glycosyltransferase
VAGIVSRLLEPATYGDFDETIYAQTILLWLRGVAPYSENFFSQGPLFLFLIGPFALLPGASLKVMQLGMTFWGSLGLIASAILGYRIAGGWGAAVSAAVVAASPRLTHVDTHVLAEGPAVALATLSLAVAWAYQPPLLRGAVAGLLFGGSLAVKSFMPMLAVPLLGRVMMSRLSTRQRVIALVALVVGAVLAILGSVLLFEPAAVFDQTVSYRLDARAAAAEASGVFVTRMSRGLNDDLGALAAALIGSLVLLRLSTRTGLLLIAWLVGTLGLLALHQPLFQRHSAAVLPPLALLASGTGLIASLALKNRIAPLLPLLTIILVIGLSIPGHIRRWTEREDMQQLLEAARALAAVSSPDEYVLTDMPAIALMADRLIVPDLVDLSGVRLGTSRVTAELVAKQIARYEPAAVLFWLGRLDSGPLESFPGSITDQYSLVWRNSPSESLWIREDVTSLNPADIPDVQALGDETFGGFISARAVSHANQARSGDVWRLRVLWQLLGRPGDVESAQIEILSTRGAVVASQILPFSPDKPISRWPGYARRMVQYEVPVAPGLEPTRARPQIRLLDRDGKALQLVSENRQQDDPWLRLSGMQITRSSSAR